MGCGTSQEAARPSPAANDNSRETLLSRVGQQAVQSSGSGSEAHSATTSFRRGLPPFMLETIRQIGPALPFPGEQACNVLAVVLQRIEVTAQNNENVKELGMRAVAFLDVLRAYSDRLDTRNWAAIKKFRKVVEMFRTVLEDIKGYAEHLDRFITAGEDKSKYEELVSKLRQLQDDVLLTAAGLETFAMLQDSLGVLNQAALYREPSQQDVVQSSPVLTYSETRLLQAVYEDIRSRSHTAPALGPPETRSSEACSNLSDLPDYLRDLHDNMPPDILMAPVRLLRIEQVLAWNTLKVYEEVDTHHEVLQMPYGETNDKLWKKVVTVSWRWSQPKPSIYERDGSPMSETQLLELKELLRKALENGLMFVWIDWSCVPQYGKDSMLEVHRSKIYYARARGFLVLPTFREFPSEGNVRAILARTSRVLSDQGKTEDNIRCRVASKIIEGIRVKNQVANLEYFGRVWTLAERMARHGREEGLSQWLTLESWLGMVVDAMLKSAEDRAASQIYKDMLGWKAVGLLEAVITPLNAAVQIGMQAPAAEGLADKVADLCKAAVDVWLSPSVLEEAPTPKWLQSYMSEKARSGVYKAWNEADLVWAVYSYFGWKSSPDLRTALENLIQIAGRDRTVYMPMFEQLRIREQPPSFLPEILEDGCNALMSASKNGRTEEVKKLLAAGANVDAQDKHGWTALMSASHSSRVEVVKALQEAGADMNVQNKDGWTALMYASKQGHTDVVKILLAKGAGKDTRNKDGWTALMSASSEGHSHVVRALLEVGSNKDVQNKSGWTALMSASQKGHTEVVKILLSAKADKDAENKGGDTALILASSEGQEEVVRRLLAAGAKTDRRNRRGQTALDVARTKKHHAVVKLLLQQV